MVFLPLGRTLVHVMTDISPMKRLLPVLLLSFLLAACSGVDVSQLVRQAIPSPSVAATTSTTDKTQEAAVKQTIDASNQAQAKAFNTGNPSLMKPYATDSFYTQLLQTNRDLASSGVTAIDIVSTDYVSVSVDGSSAKATTSETWRSTYRDGTSDESTARNDYSLVLVGATWKVDSDDQSTGLAQPAPATRPNPGQTGPAASNFSTSSNWSGYAASGGKFTSVTGTWTVPTVLGTIAGADATWVGIGGIDTRDLIQAGTQATVNGGDVEYEAWIEMLPASSRPVSLTVNAGDSVTVTLTQKSDVDWTILILNNTTGGKYSTTVKYTSSNSSAEWVQEAPSAGRGTIPLDDFGTLQFTDASAVKDGATQDLKGLGAQAITMINGLREPLASPSVLGADGKSFSVTRTQNQSTSAGGQRRRRG